MKFTVQRTSLLFDRKAKPCEEAVLDKNQTWCMKITNLKALMELINKYEQVVIQKEGDGTFTLEIYDDYREY